MYARAWGYDPSKLERPLSYWPATPTAAAGVAILVSPDSAIQEITPWQPSLWSPFFVAVQGKYEDASITVICVYGATRRSQREALFRQLPAVDPPEGLVIVGGDFNCVLDAELDRSRWSHSSRTSDGLCALLDAWSLTDALTDDMLAAASRDDIATFRAEHHSFMYPLRDGAFATARLDRWYVSRDQYAQVGRVTTTAPVARSDHDSVALQLLARTAPPRSTGRSSPQLRYPLPRCAADSILRCGRELLENQGRPLTVLPANAAARGWDELKAEIRRRSLRTRRECLTAATARYRARLRRLKKSLYDAHKALRAPTRPQSPTLASITDAISALALDPAARYKSIRRTLVSLQQVGTQRRQLHRHASHASKSHESARAFYKRISVKFCRRQARSLETIAGSDLSPADRIAHDWRPITQRPPCDPDQQDRLFAALPAKSARPELQIMDAPFSAEEVARAIRACPRGKACGPDGLSNDWYRDQLDTLPEVLAPLYTKWYQAGILPASFVNASVFCVPKKTAPTTGLDFRPIALLNTDYKVYSRVLLTRLQAHVAALVSPTQYGFVPGRQVHDAIDIWTAFQHRASTANLPSTAMAVFPDFAKAYDSLDRRFLALALRRHGFSEMLVAAVTAMHLDTTAAYVADGQTSAPEEVTTGIRQGCPFAPTLFILAVDVLYEMIQSNSELPGLPLSDQVSVSIVGFADDTTTYLQTPRECSVLLSVLDDFACASGLRVNASKSVAVALTPADLLSTPTEIPFPLAPPSQLVRYLGAQIATSLKLGAVWDVTVQQLRARLHLAVNKTTDLLQRVQVCQAVILPKLLYVARHAWPNASITRRLQRLIHNYAWHGLFQDSGVQRRAWMNSAVASAPRSAGGLQLPALHDEFLLLSAATVTRWLSATDAIAAATGRILATGTTGRRPIPHVAPGRGPSPPPKLHATLAASGTSLLRRAATYDRGADECAASMTLLGSAGRAPPSCGKWLDGWYHRDYNRLLAPLSRLDDLQHQLYGRLNFATLLATPVLGSGLLLHVTGRQLVAADLPGLACSTTVVGDLLEIAWVAPRVLEFRLRHATHTAP